jgi:hypothetical protein
MNEWICITAQYEKMINRLGKQLYQAYKSGELTDEDACAHCRVLDGIFEQAKSVRSELKFDVECRLGSRLKTQAGEAKLKKRAKGGLKPFLSASILGYWDERNMPGYRESARDSIAALANRALASADRNTPLLHTKQHQKLCELALALETDCQKSWQQVIQLREKQRNVLTFDTISVNFLVSFAAFMRKQRHGKKFLKFVKYNETVELAKLLARYASRPEGVTLRAELGLAC